MRASILGLCLALPLACQGAAAGKGAAAGLDVGERYAERAAAVKADDVSGHYRLARWCKKQGLTDQMRHHALFVLAAYPQHTATRQLLGQQKIDGAWVRAEDLTDATAARAKAEAQKAARGEFERQLLDVRSPDASTRALAYRIAVGLADKHEMPEWKARADGELAAANNRWRRADRFRATRPVGVFQLNLQRSRLTGLRTVPVSFGNGGSGRIQLPTLESISIGTTVGIPLGIARRR